MIEVMLIGFFLYQEPILGFMHAALKSLIFCEYFGIFLKNFLE